MKYPKLPGLLILSIFASTNAYAGEKYSGKWEGKTRTSIEIRSKSPIIVRYCFNRDCSLHEPRGTLANMRFTFRKRGNFPGAVMTMKKSNGKYLGVYRRNGSAKKFTATLSN